MVQEHGAIVWKTVSRLLDNEADAADCFQDTFVSALNVSRAQTVRNWPGLLKRLATARALDRLRQRRQESSRCTGMPDGFHPAEKAAGPSRVAEARELAEHLCSARSIWTASKPRSSVSRAWRISTTARLRSNLD